MPSTTPSLPPDVSSLRAAALMTLRSKSRPRHPPIAPGKRTSPDYPDDNSSVASTRRAIPSPELDYGSDDGLADAEGSTEEEEGGEKEEGEISEDEAPSKPPASMTVINIDEEPLPGLMSSFNHRKTDSDFESSQVKRTQASSFSLGSNSVANNRPITNPVRSPLLKAKNLRSPYVSTQPSDSRVRPFSFSKLPTPISHHSAPSPSPYTSSLSVHDNGANIPTELQLIRVQHNGMSQGTESNSVRSGNKFSSLSESHVSEPASSVVSSDGDKKDGHNSLVYARPSVKMTIQEFSEAKSIILDLLGWGVPSDYFVNCGLTREVIYYIFTELNLKLPGNLNVKGIRPYGPSDYTKYIHDLFEELVDSAVTDGHPVQTSAMSTMRPAIVPSTFQHPLPLKPTTLMSKTELNIQSHEPNKQVGKMNGPSFSLGDNMLNNKKRSLSPSDPIPGLQGQFSAPHPTPIASTTHFDTPKHGYTGNLDEIETLRRKELLARKAVLASRKLKKSASASVTSAIINGSASSGQAISSSVAPETVDNFLKSITSNAVDDDHSVMQTSSNPSDMMEVDSEPEPLLPSSDKARSATWSNPQRTHSPLISEQPRMIPRKGTLKRPVASDFVDYDANSHGSQPPPSLDISLPDTKVNSRPSLSTAPSFANLLPSRKVVIDFSDTEEEDAMEDVNYSQDDPSATQTPRMASVSPHNSNGSGTPEPGRITPSAPVTPSITPDILFQKELEIKRMKLLIAEREKNRVKLLQSRSVASPLPRSTSTDTFTPKSPISTVIVQEDIALEQSAPPMRQDENAPDEDAVMRDTNLTASSATNIYNDSTVQSTDTSTPERAINTQNQVLTSDVIHEQVVIDEDISSSVPIPMITGVIQQARNVPGDIKHYSTYSSPLAPFVSLTSSISVDTLSTFPSLHFPSSSHTSFSPPPSPFLLSDIPILQQIPTLLRPVKETALRKLDPKRSICQFEIPGAGNCRDPTCSNVHLRDFEPGDDETAQYLAKILPAPQPSVQVLKATLARIRASKQDLDLNARVCQALLQLGVR